MIIKNIKLEWLLKSESVTIPVFKMTLFVDFLCLLTVSMPY